ncbi:MAG: phage holin family protein [Patescibacteria group bacterium]|nr:phage holin family protein [Patescibacteria group bacterium]
MKLLVRFLGSVLAILAAAYFVPGVTVSNFFAALLIAIVLGVLNVTVKPLITLLTLPFTLLTLGLFTFVINGLILWLAAAFVPGFSVAGFIPAFLGALVIAVVNWILHKFI